MHPTARETSGTATEHRQAWPNTATSTPGTRRLRLDPRTGAIAPSEEAQAHEKAYLEKVEARQAEENRKRREQREMEAEQ